MERKKSLTLNLNTVEFDSMCINLKFSSKQEPEEGREKRIARILERFSQLPPELQEAVIKYAESLDMGQKDNNGQGSST